MISQRPNPACHVVFTSANFSRPATLLCKLASFYDYYCHYSRINRRHRPVSLMLLIAAQVRVQCIPPTRSRFGIYYLPPPALVAVHRLSALLAFTVMLWFANYSYMLAFITLELVCWWLMYRSDPVQLAPIHI